MKKKIAIIVTTLPTVNAFLLQHIRELLKKYSVTLFVNVEGREFDHNLPEGALIKHVPFSRKPHLFIDLYSLLILIRAFSCKRYDLVLSITPKAGFLGMITAFLMGVPCRIHIFTGQVWATRGGLLRAFLKCIDIITARCCTVPLADSRSQLDFLKHERVLRNGSGIVLGHGSISGVNISRFIPDKAIRSVVRRELGITNETFTFLFLGRLNKEKGVLDLVHALVILKEMIDQPFRLVLVGPDEEDICKQLKLIDGVVAGEICYVGFTSQPHRYLAAADVFCLPSHREGFGTSIIEAASVGIPTVASDIYGIQDAVENGVTGLLHNPGDALAIAKTLAILMSDDDMRIKMGEAARSRAIRYFNSIRVTRLLVKFIDRNLIN